MKILLFVLLKLLYCSQPNQVKNLDTIYISKAQTTAAKTKWKPPKKKKKLTN